MRRHHYKEPYKAPEVPALPLEAKDLKVGDLIWVEMPTERYGLVMGQCCLILDTFDLEDKIEFSVMYLDSKTTTILGWTKGFSLSLAGWRRSQYV